MLVNGAEQYVIGGLAAFEPTPIRNDELGSRLGVPMEELGKVLLELEEKDVVTIDDENRVRLTGKSLGACGLCKHEITEEPYHVLTHNSDNIRSEERYVLHERCAEVLTFMLKY